MAYVFQMNGAEVRCDTVEELLRAQALGLIDGMGKTSKPEIDSPTPAQQPLQERAPARKSGGSQGRGPKQSWEESRKRAEEKGISLWEARGQIAREKKELRKKIEAEIQKKTK